MVKNAQMNHAIECICHRGCRYVNSILADDDARQACKELQTLNSVQQRSVLKELKSVMSVYGETGSCQV